MNQSSASVGGGNSSATRPGAAATLPSRTAVLADRLLPALVLSPTILLSFVFVYVFTLVTGFLSFSPSTLMPRYQFIGLARYRELFANDIWWQAVGNLAWFGVPFVLLCMGLGLLLAILLDQRIRGEGLLRAIYLYPLALSQVVAGTVWQWMFSPGYGIERLVQDLGFAHFRFAWISDTRTAIFCVVIAASWQCIGFVAALFLAGLRGVNEDVIKAAQVDGASPVRMYRRIIIPTIAPVFFSVGLILTHLAIKTFDLVVAMTAGGPGTSTNLPSLFMYTYSFERGRMGIGAASSMMMMVLIIAVLVPLMYAGSRVTHGNR